MRYVRKWSRQDPQKKEEYNFTGNDIYEMYTGLNMCMPLIANVTNIPMSAVSDFVYTQELFHDFKHEIKTLKGRQKQAIYMKEWGNFNEAKKEGEIFLEEENDFLAEFGL